jgi:hypothetical protein
MSTAEKYRAFARQCVGWADSADTIAHRETLLDMATRWVEAAARLDLSDAKSSTRAARNTSGADGGGLPKETNGGAQLKPSEAARHAKRQHQQQDRGETSVD